MEIKSPLVSEPAEVSASEFRAACGLFPTGVTIVTRRRADGRAAGMTVSSFTSVSLDPPLILVCIDKRAGFIVGLEHARTFAVNVLSDEQQDLALRFASPPEPDRFTGAKWAEGWEGLPILQGVVASFACALHQVVEAGDHFVLIGLVREIRRSAGRSLVWCESRYHCLPTPREYDG